MNPSEVTLLTRTNDGFYTTKLVSKLGDAIKALSRGFFSFGDLLQTNFATAESSK
jgi:hypothetical protein